MKLKHGNMLHQECDALIFSGNAFVKKDGTLVMGRGAAKDIRDAYPESAEKFGSMITHYAKQQPLYNSKQAFKTSYGFLIYEHEPSQFIPGSLLGVFQVKYHWHDEAQFSLIRRATTMLGIYAEGEGGKLKLSLNFPGIGNGGLRRKDVLEIIRVLPDNVTVWEFA